MLGCAAIRADGGFACAGVAGPGADPCGDARAGVGAVDAAARAGGGAFAAGAVDAAFAGVSVTSRRGPPCFAACDAVCHSSPSVFPPHFFPLLHCRPPNSRCEGSVVVALPYGYPITADIYSYIIPRMYYAGYGAQICARGQCADIPTGAKYVAGAVWRRGIGFAP